MTARARDSRRFGLLALLAASSLLCGCGRGDVGGGGSAGTASKGAQAGSAALVGAAGTGARARAGAATGTAAGTSTSTGAAAGTAAGTSTSTSTSTGTGAGVAASPSGERLHLAHHARWVTGDIALAERILARLLDDEDAPSPARARAALRLASIAETRRERRKAVGYLDRVVELVGGRHALGRRAEDRRRRIRFAAPLAGVRGPAPGTVLAGEPPAVAALFRRAETRLVGFHRVVVAPRLENIDAVLRRKRQLLAGAIKAYEKAIERGSAQAKAAGQYRIGTMYHHFAEALAFRQPPELLPSVAQRLMRRLRAESASYLRKALSRYKRASKVSDAVARRWRLLAQREGTTLARVLARSRGRGR